MKAIAPKLGILALMIAVLTVSVSSVYADEAEVNGQRGGFKFQQMDEEKLQEMEQNRAEMQEHQEAMKEALDAGDYDAWAELVPEDSPMAEAINEDNFYKLIEAHDLREEAQELMEEAREIMEELGVEGPGNGNGRRGFGRGFAPIAE